MSELKINENAINFISDWKKRTDEQQRKYLLLSIGAFFLAAIACIATFFWYQNENYRKIVDQNMNYIQDSTIQETNQIEREMKAGENLIINLANQYATLIEVDAQTTVEEKLTLLTDDSIFDRIAFVSPNGTDVSLEGIAHVSDRAYFQNAMKGKTGWQSLDQSRVTNKPTVVFYAPVKVEGEIVGVMMGFYEQDKLNSLFSYNFFNFKPDTYLLMGDGKMIASSVYNTPMINMLEKLSTKKFIGSTDYQKIEEIIHDDSRTMVTFSYYDENGKTKVGTIVQFTNSDSMIFSVLPGEITSSMVKNSTKLGTILLFAIIIIFVLVFMIMIMSFKKQRDHLEAEITNAIENLKDTVNDEKRQLAIIESLVDIYSSVYYVDLNKNRYSRIKETTGINDKIPDVGIASEGFSLYISNFIDKSDKQEMAKFVDLNTINARLKNTNSVSIDYKRIEKGWFRGTLAVASRDVNGNLASFVFAVHSIEDEKNYELQTKKALQEAYEAAQLASNAKTTFLSNMSHDIRTPMNAIIGMTAIAGANLDNQEKVEDCLKKITLSSKHLLALINEVLDMSKIESGKVDLSEECFSLSDTIDELISLHQPLINEKHHTLKVKVNDVKHENVIGDSTRLQQVFSNLLSNAIKYTHDNGLIEISVTEKQTNKNNIGFYEVVFKDNGIGMDEEFQHAIFEPFARARDKTISKIQGTGLGMPIAKNIIRMMNGDIKVESKLGEGSTFTVTFALKLQQNDEINYHNFVDLPVLVVDDDIISCENACYILNNLEMKSEYVTSGKAAVEKTVKHHNDNDDYYAVIIDWKMPEMDGVETTKEIRKQVGDDVPIIVISAYDWTEIEREAREAGANAFLSKPLFKSKVAGLFNELIGSNKSDEVTSLESETKKHDFTGTRVLLVEDNEINREITIELLSMLGIETEFAENGKIGVDKFEQSESGYYDLIFMDIQMPVMNGYESTTAIRALNHPDAKIIPIVAMTANAFSSDVRNAFNAGMNGHIPKPLDINQIIKALYDNLKK